jgi:hypothetical protein
MKITEKYWKRTWGETSSYKTLRSQGVAKSSTCSSLLWEIDTYKSQGAKTEETKETPHASMMRKEKKKDNRT